VLALGADAGDAQKLAQLSEMLVALPINKLCKIHKGPSGTRVLSNISTQNLMQMFAAAESMWNGG
jgi:hypothetical protein